MVELIPKIQGKEMVDLHTLLAVQLQVLVELLSRVKIEADTAAELAPKKKSQGKNKAPW